MARTRAARAAAATPWHEVVRHRAQAEARAKEARRAKEESARQGKAISRPKTGGPKLSLAGMGEALHTNKITCRECKSIQWLPDGWRERLDETDYYCSICSRTQSHGLGSYVPSSGMVRRYDPIASIGGSGRASASMPAARSEIARGSKMM